MHRNSVLIVAESPFHLALMADLLEANGVRATRTRDAKAALAAMQGHSPTLVVLDLDLPERTCESVVRGLQSRPETRDIPVVVVGEESQRAAADRFLAKCQGRAVAKPIDTAGFPRTVLHEIRRRTTSIAREAMV